MIIPSTRRMSLAIVMAALSGLLLVPNALAAAPLHDGPYTWDDTYYGSCGSAFDVRLDTHGWEAFTVWADANGDITKVLYRVRAPHDVFTNLSTGRQIVVRGEFQEIIERVPGTDEFTKSISGFRYLINDPGVGVIFQEVGRIVYGDLEQTIVLWQAGKHEGVFDADFDVFCDFLAQPA